MKKLSKKKVREWIKESLENFVWVACYSGVNRREILSVMEEIVLDMKEKEPE